MNRIEDQANYYKNLHLRDRSIKAVVHVENKDDEAFWNVQLQTVHTGHYHFISQSRNENGVNANGCEQCLKYRPYVNRQFFICIDSDLRLLLGEEELTPKKYIAQTYAYSWENHSCEASYLDQRYEEKVKDCDFNFTYFLTELSHIIYKPLLYLVYHQSSGLNRQWNISKFNKCMPTQLRREELNDNGQPYLQKIKQYFNTELGPLNLPKNFAIKDLTPNNAYLHMQGHKIYDLVANIGKLLCRGKRISFKTDVLDSGFPVSGYSEIDNVQSDLTTILQE